MKQSVRVTEDGFELSGVSPSPVPVRWDALATITGFKRDLLTEDRICFLLKLHGAAASVEIHEDMNGFDDVVAQMEKRGLVPESWHAMIMEPAFATNTVQLFPGAFNFQLHHE